MRIRLLLLFLASASILPSQSKVMHLPIGDPARKDREAPVVLDAVTDTADGSLISPGEMARRLASTRIVFLGESHTSAGFHLVQHRTIEELHRMGRKVMIGLEMYPYTEQRSLDEWCDGLLTEKGFVELSHWYKNWGYHWNYYRDIFLYAQAQGIRMFAINTPREVISAVRKKGFQNLTPEEAAHIPSSVDTASPEHYTLFKAFFEGAEGVHAPMPEPQWKAMFDAQCAWDATMAFNAVEALRRHGKADAVMVVLIGSGHVAYGLGIQRQAQRWYDGKMASLVPIPVLDEKQRPVVSVQASYADFLWGLPHEKDPLYPELGIATGDVPGERRRKVLSVSSDSVAKDAGFRVGDVLVSMDGFAIEDREVLNRMLSEKRWGDAASFVVRRGEGEVPLEVRFRRTPPSIPTVARPQEGR